MSREVEEIAKGVLIGVAAMLIVQWLTPKLGLAPPPPSTSKPRALPRVIDAS